MNDQVKNFVLCNRYSSVCWTDQIKNFLFEPVDVLCVEEINEDCKSLLTEIIKSKKVKSILCLKPVEHDHFYQIINSLYACPCELLNALEVYQFPLEQKQRFGNKEDGGYVISKLEGNYDCYISAGVGTDESFSRDFILNHASYLSREDIYAFDGTIEDYPRQYIQNINFQKLNIGSENIFNKTTNLQAQIKAYKNIFLKMDIEGGEFEWLNTLSTEDLQAFKQIVIEVHGLLDDSFGSKYLDKWKALRNLTQTHQLVHAHGNNHIDRVGLIPPVLELTYIRTDQAITCQKNATPFPVQDLDFKCHPFKEEFNLNFYPFQDLS